MTLEEWKNIAAGMGVLSWCISRSWRSVSPWVFKQSSCAASDRITVVYVQVILSDSKKYSGLLRNALEIIGRSSIPDAAIEAFSMVPDWVRLSSTAGKVSLFLQLYTYLVRHKLTNITFRRYQYMTRNNSCNPLCGWWLNTRSACVLPKTLLVPLCTVCLIVAYL